MFTRVILKSSPLERSLRHLISIPRLSYNIHPVIPKKPLEHFSRVSANSFSTTSRLLKHMEKAAQVGPNGSISTLPIRDTAGHSNAMATPLNPMDVYRTHISEFLSPITGVPASEILPKLQWTQTQDKGDIMLAVPALRIKGKKPAEQAVEFAGKV